MLLNLKHRLLTPTWPGIAVVALVLAFADAGARLAGDTLVPGGPLDEVAHLCTGLLVLWALGRRASERLLAPVLLASVTIDLDHLPGALGAGWLTAGTPRPYTHSLLTIGVVLIGAGVATRRRDVLLGIALGIAVHFWRDLSEPGSGVALLWPWSHRSLQVPHAAYLASVAVILAAAAWRHRCCRRRPATAMS